MTNSNLQGRSSRKEKAILKGSSAISALKFGLALVVFTVFLVACPQPAPTPTPVVTVDPPTFNPETGATPTRARDAELTINHPNSEAIIRYNAGTGNVLNPTVSGNTGGMTYDPQNKPTFGELSLAGGMLTVKAIAIVSGTSSTAAEATYTVAVPSVIISATEITATEEGTMGMYTVRLTSRPATGTAVVVYTEPSSINITLSPRHLWFVGHDNWSESLPVTVSAPHDTNNVDNDFTITHTLIPPPGATPDPAYYRATFPIPSVAVTVLDNEPGVRFSTTALTAVEGGPMVTYTVALQKRPAINSAVLINVIERSEDIEIVSTPAELWFTSAANWNRPQTVTVMIVDDSFMEGEHTAVIRHSLNSSSAGATTPDPAYYNASPRIVPPNVTITIEDND